MDPGQETTASNLINDLEVQDLRRILRDYGEESQAGRIARAIVAGRQSTPIATSRQLADIVVAAVGLRHYRTKRIHPATRTFMALRIAVNRELDTIAETIAQVDGWLNPGGRLCVIAFHSLEDRIVKQGLRALSQGCRCPGDLPQCVCGETPSLRLICRRAIKPSAVEIETNPLARSARLRVAEKM
jgi:16S rRNA (cytosine1402-N4)-methyltransferase